MYNLGDPGKPAVFFVLWPCQKCHTFGRGISCCYQLFLEEVRCIPDTIFYELYVVKVWEGMVWNSFSCQTVPKAWHAPCILCVPFPVVLFLQYCMLEDSSTKHEMSDIIICMRGMRGRNLVW